MRIPARATALDSLRRKVMRAGRGEVCDLEALRPEAEA